MKQLNYLKTDNMKEIKTFFKVTKQFDNEYVKVLQHGKCFFLEHYTGVNLEYFVINTRDADEAIKIAKEHIYTYCDQVATDSFDDLTSTKMELAKWELFDLESNQADKNADFVQVVEEKFFNGYTHLISHGVYSYADALAKKEELENANVYHFQHNEYARPVFYLIESE